MKRNMRLYGAIALFFFLLGCGGLRYSQVAPEAKDFHPKRIGILPIDAGPYEEAGGIVGETIADDLIKRKWFQNVVTADALNRQLQTNKILKAAVTEYVAKLKSVNFSDPELSRKIGELIKVDAFLIVNLDFWQYAVENKDTLAKVGFSIRMIHANKGSVLWNSSHHEAESYIWIKPELASVARKVVGMMMDEMPH